MRANHYMEYLDDKRRFVIFRISTIPCAIDIVYVNEIVGTSSLISREAEEVITLHGLNIPLLDLRQRFKQEVCPYNGDTAIIVIEISGVKIGMIVDYIVDVITLRNDQMNITSMDQKVIESEYIEQTLHFNHQNGLVIDIEKIVDEETFSLLLDCIPYSEAS